MPTIQALIFNLYITKFKKLLSYLQLIKLYNFI